MNTASLHRIFTPFLALALTSVVGCIRLGEFTDGMEGRARFSISGSGCFFGCALRPLTAGESATLTISGDDMPVGLLLAADPEVLIGELETNLSCCSHEDSGTTCSTVHSASVCAGDLSVSYLARVEARGAGTTPLVLISRDGTIFDRVPIEVTAATDTP